MLSEWMMYKKLELIVGKIKRETNATLQRKSVFILLETYRMQRIMRTK
jgi:hypothetical protein